MRRPQTLVFVFLMLANLASLAQSLAAPSNQLLVRFEDSISDERIADINARLGARVVNKMSGGRLYLLEIEYANVLNQIVQAYQKTPGVRFAEPNHELRLPSGRESEIPKSLPEKGPRPSKPAGNPELIELPKVSKARCLS